MLGNSKIMTNIMVRVSIIPQILNNLAIYYQYDIQEGDTPEIIAHKYYGDSYRYLDSFICQSVDGSTMGIATITK
jgi:hypothetical protein